MIAIASILSGCMTKDSLNTLKKLVVEKEIKDYVASNYPIESLEIDLLSSEIYDNCMDVINGYLHYMVEISCVIHRHHFNIMGVYV